MKSGIYQIRNVSNNKLYIGSTNNFGKRKNSHFSKLSKQIHHSCHLQRSYNKYGKENFVFEMLFTCPDSELIRIEQYFINNYRPEYNILKVAGSHKGKIVSQETRDKLRTINLGKKQSEETKKKISLKLIGKRFSEDEKDIKYKNRRRSVYKIDIKTLEILAEFKTITEAAKFANTYVSGISAAARGEIFSAGGFCWTFTDDYSLDALKTRKNKRPGRQIVQFDFNMNVINVYDSILEASKITNLCDTNIGSNLRNKTRHAGGFIWKYKNQEDANK